MKRILSLFLLFPILCHAQIYKYIGVEEGLSNRRVYSIEKDQKGYMWFLTHGGMERYDGKEVKTYRLMDGKEELSSLINLNWMHLDSTGKLWEIGRKGRIFCYDSCNDIFRLVFRLPGEEAVVPVTYSFIDSNDAIWLCNEDYIYLYNTKNGKVERLVNQLHGSITSIIQVAFNCYFIGTEKGIHYARIRGKEMTLLSCDKLDHLEFEVNSMYFDNESGKLFIATFQQGVYVYDMNRKTLSLGAWGLKNISIVHLCPLNKTTLLLATEGAGVYRMNMDTYKAVPFLVADRRSYTGLNGNTIADIYVDSDKRIWVADYPNGVTICDWRYSSYTWIRSNEANNQSLINNQVNTILEDSEGDLWFGTSNGISLYHSSSGKWHAFSASIGSESRQKDHIFITLCEVSPGVIWAAGYSPDILQIDKHRLSQKWLNVPGIDGDRMRPDKYIRQIVKDTQGNLWAGGYYNLTCFDRTTRAVRFYPGLNSITTLVEKDDQHMWIGTAMGVLLLNKHSGEFQNLALPIESNYINALNQDADGKLYIGTNGSGLLVYDSRQHTFQHYATSNCSLISNNIYTILFNTDGNVILSTEKGLSSFTPSTQIFHNWTTDQGLMPNHFNPQSGIVRQTGNLVFGSSNGAVEFNKQIQIPERNTSRMVFQDFKIFYQSVTPESEDSPLITDIDNTCELRLKYAQNLFSLRVSSINYDYPSNILYSWKLEGFYEEWSKPGHEDIIRFTNLYPGHYTLRVRTISNEDNGLVLEERSIHILIERPLWLSWWAITCYLLFIVSSCGSILYFLSIKKQRKISEEKVNFFINTAHDLRTPITLIKAPLEDIEAKEPLSPEARLNLETALRSANSLFRLTTNLIDLERANTYTSELYVAEFDLDDFLAEIIGLFRTYAITKGVHLRYKNDHNNLHVWFDRNKMDSILKNLISNAIKYTPAGGVVTVSVAEAIHSWSVEVNDTGIGIPVDEQHKLFRFFFRATNAINSKVVGSGIGLMLVQKLVKMHQGSITWESNEGVGTIVRVSFPKGEKHLSKARLVEKRSEEPLPDALDAVEAQLLSHEKVTEEETNRYRLLVAEDNDELRHYLGRSLSEQYTVLTCTNGQEALELVKTYRPDLILSDVMMPEMSGHELCAGIKSDIETSHIPVVLLTALDDKESILKGLHTGADEYITKPFNLEILHAIISNTLSVRATLRAKYSSLKEREEMESAIEVTGQLNPLDWKFINTVNQDIEKHLHAQNYKIDALCASLGMCRTSLYNKLRALTGLNPSEYIRLIRLKHAAQMLKDSAYSVTEVAERTGFCDTKYFRTVFKKYYKVSPSEYAVGKTERLATLEK